LTRPSPDPVGAGPPAAGAADHRRTPSPESPPTLTPVVNQPKVTPLGLPTFYPAGSAAGLARFRPAAPPPWARDPIAWL
jgi:hypothetical protein